MDIVDQIVNSPADGRDLPADPVADDSREPCTRREG